MGSIGGAFLRRRQKVAALICLMALLPLMSFHPPVSRAALQKPALRLFDDFRPGWDQHWMERKMADRLTSYEVVGVEGRGRVLKATSANAASAFWRALSHPAEGGKLSWRWRVEKSLRGNNKEKTRDGDDYAARVMIFFGPELFSLETRAICYVWAASQPVGSAYPNPFAGNVATIVLESGDERAGQWVHETRDFVTDFGRAFGRRPEMVGAVAVIVDTDNTGETATAWFDDLEIAYSD